MRESVPWAIDEDEYDFACLASTLKEAVLGRDAFDSAVTVANAEDAYHSALGRFTQSDNRPNCEKWVVGVMGDNRYPQTVGASEYSARFYLEFNFPDFSCEDSSAAATDAGGFALASHKNKCIQNNLRFVRDADVVLNEADSPRWVVRLTEAKKRADGQFVKWRDAGSLLPQRAAQRRGVVAPQGARLGRVRDQLRVSDHGSVAVRRRGQNLRRRRVRLCHHQRRQEDAADGLTSGGTATPSRRATSRMGSSGAPRMASGTPTRRSPTP